MTEMALDASQRRGFGKGPMRRLRRDGMIPGIVYGLAKPVPVQVESRVATKLVHLLHGSERMISLRLADEEGKNHQDHHVLLKEVQTEPVSQQVLHIDFLEVEINKPVQVTVEWHPVGIPEGVRMGGVLQAVKHDVQVECLPLEIPEFIEVDVNALEIGDSLHVKDLVLPPGIRVLTDPEETLIVISAPRVEEEAVPGEELEEGEEGAAEAGETPAGEKAESESEQE